MALLDYNMLSLIDTRMMRVTHVIPVISSDDLTLVEMFENKRMMTFDRLVAALDPK
ncbi:hypothetical protein [Halorubrum sp. Ea1]|uniref:hypothetical protein n=1 Tax=Halorubrum sp. Ea1 TaxID=1480718 RepID=UPI0015963514|nr:hypothetical protein [Halorubrum sp. Ea1]